MFKNKKEIFSFRKYKDGRTDTAKIGATALLLGSALAFGGTSASASESNVTLTDSANQAETVTYKEVFDAGETTPDKANTFTTPAGTDTANANVVADVKYVEENTTNEIDARLNNQNVATATVETQYDKQNLEAATDGKNYSTSTVTAGPVDETVGKKEQITNAGKEYVYTRSELTGDADTARDFTPTTFNDAELKVSPEALHTATGEVDYAALPTGRVIIVEELTDGTYGKFVVSDNATATDDTTTVKAFKAGEATAATLSKAELDKLALTIGDSIVVLDRDTFATKEHIPGTPLDATFDGNMFSSIVPFDYRVTTNPDSVPLPTMEKARLGALQTLDAYVGKDIVDHIKDNYDIDYDGKPKTPGAPPATQTIADVPLTEITITREQILKALDEGSVDEVRLINSGSYTYFTDAELEEYILTGNTPNHHWDGSLAPKILEGKHPVPEYQAMLDKLPATLSANEAANFLIELSIVRQKEIARAAVQAQKVVDKINSEKATSSVDVNPADNTAIAKTDAQPLKVIVEGTTDITISIEGGKSPDESRYTPGEVITPIRAYKVVTPTPVTLTHYYKEKDKGSVVVHYVDAATGKDIDLTVAPDEKPVTDQYINGQEYDTTALQKPTIVTADGKTYRFVGVSDKANVGGKDVVTEGTDERVGADKAVLAKGTTHVINTYELVTGDVKTYFVDETGKELKAPAVDTDKGNLNAPYNAAETDVEQPKEFELDGVTYRLKEVATQGTVGTTEVVKSDDKNFIGATNGTVKEGTTHVINVYKPVTGDVKVYFVDEAGKELKVPFEDKNDENLKVGYEVTATEAPTEFKVGDVTYRFVEDAKAGKVGEVQVAPEDKTNVVAGSTGTVVEGTTHVIKVYKPVLGDVKAYFVDENAKQLKAPFEDTKQGNLDANYELTDAEAPKEFVVDGVTYRFKEVSPTPAVNGTEVAPAEDKANFIGQPTGTVKEGTTHIVNVYVPVTGDVKTYFVDETGKELKAPAVDTDKGNLNAPYNAAETDVEQPKEFELDGVTYRLKEVATQGTVGTTEVVKTDDKNFIGTAAGTVKEGTTHVINVYAPVTGDVKAYFVDEAGKELKAPFEDTNDANLKTNYELTDAEAPKEFKVGDVTYRFKEVSKEATVGGTAVAPTSDKDFLGQATGTVVEGTTHIVNVYTPVLGDVTIHFVDKEGNKIQEPVNDTVKGNLDAAYEVTGDTEQPKTLKVGEVTYRFTTVSPEATVGGKEVVTTDATNFVGTGTGTVKEGVTHVINVYEPVLGNVKAYFVDEAGNELQAPVEDTVNGNLDAPYNAAEGTEQPKEIKVGEKVYRLKTVATSGTVGEKVVVTEDGSNFIGAEAGTVKEGTTHVINVYEEVKGNVVVNYKSEGGEVLQAQAEDTPKSSIGTPYDTTDNGLKPLRITLQDGRIFELVEGKTEGSEDGKVKEGTTEITYIYKEILGNVVVNYQSEDGEKLQEQKEDTVPSSVGTDYNTTDNDFKPNRIVTPDERTFELVEDKTQGKETGDVVEGTTAITYIYKEIKGNVVVNYKSEAGEVLQPQAQDTAETSTGTPYDTTDNNFKPNRITTADGRIFELVPEKTEGTEGGKVKEGTTEVTYVYKEILGNVVVNYKSEAGEELQAPAEDTPKSSVGTAYNTTDNNFKPTTIITQDGRTFELVEAKTEGTEEGKVVEGETKVTYIYKELKGTVVVNYKSEAGEELQAPAVDTPESSTGVAYNTTDNNLKPTTIVTQDGRTFELVPAKTEGTEEGKVVVGETKVTYIYKELKGTVVVNYKSEAGEELQAPAVDTPESSTGVAYNTTDNNLKPNRITLTDGRVFELVPTKTEGTEEGKVVVGETKVTYIYKEITGKVVVNYVSETGEVLQAPVTDTENGSINSPYNTTDNKPTTITTADGRTFELVEAKTEGTEDGKVTEGTTQVTYVYKEVPKPVTPPTEPTPPAPGEPTPPTPGEPTPPAPGEPTPPTPGEPTPPTPGEPTPPTPGEPTPPTPGTPTPGEPTPPTPGEPTPPAPGEPTPPTPGEPTPPTPGEPTPPAPGEPTPPTPGEPTPPTPGEPTPPTPGEPTPPTPGEPTPPTPGEPTPPAPGEPTPGEPTPPTPGTPTPGTPTPGTPTPGTPTPGTPTPGTPTPGTPTPGTPTPGTPTPGTPTPGTPTPGTPTPGTPTPPTPGKPSPKVSKPAAKPAQAGALPKTSATGTETNSALPAGLAAALAAAGLLSARRRKEDK